MSGKCCFAIYFVLHYDWCVSIFVKGSLFGTRRFLPCSISTICHDCCYVPSLQYVTIVAMFHLYNMSRLLLCSISTICHDCCYVQSLQYVTIVAMFHLYNMSGLLLCSISTIYHDCFWWSRNCKPFRSSWPFSSLGHRQP
jgi:hypothetical protein